MRVKNVSEGAKGPVSRVFFPKVAAFTLEPLTKEETESNPRYTEMDYSSREKLVKMYQARGWSERAIVVLSGRHDFWNNNPNNWGVVVNVSAAKVYDKPYYPFVIKWVKDGSFSNHWPEDLVFLHSALTVAEIEWAVRDQGG